jgi:hypothetical protein
MKGHIKTIVVKFSICLQLNVAQTVVFTYRIVYLRGKEVLSVNTSILYMSESFAYIHNDV